MDLQEFMRYLSGQRAELERTTLTQSEVGVVLQVGDSSCVVCFQRQGVKVVVPKQQLTNPRVGQRVRVKRNAAGEWGQTNRTPTHRSTPLPIPQNTGIPTGNPSYYGPQKWEFLWRPTLNRLDPTKPAFSAELTAPTPTSYSDGSPRHSDPLDDLGQAHPNYYGLGTSTVWQEINHQTRTAFQPSYSVFDSTTYHYLTGVSQRYQLAVNIPFHNVFLTPPWGSMTLEEYLDGWPKYASGGGGVNPEGREIYSQPYIEVGAPVTSSSTRTVVTFQGSTLDYPTGAENFLANEDEQSYGNWHTARLWVESEVRTYVDGITNVTRWRSLADGLRIVVYYTPSYSPYTAQYEMNPTGGIWYAHTSETGEWWLVSIPIAAGPFEFFGTNDMPLGYVDYDPALWTGPTPTCDPDTGEFDPETSFRWLDFPNSLYVSMPTGDPPIEPQPPMEFTPGVTGPDLGGTWEVRNPEVEWGYAEKLGPASEVLVNGSALAGTWDYWAALRHQQSGGDTQTLLLCKPEGITVLLDLGAPQEFAWPTFWADVGLPEDLVFKAAVSLLAHHSFPLADAYLGATLDGQDYVLVLSHLHPWRDLTARQWAEQGLQKPRTYAEYLLYTGPTPTNTSGLTCVGVIPTPIPEASRPNYTGVIPLGYPAIPLKMLPAPIGTQTMVTPTSVSILDWTGTPEARAAAEAAALTLLSKNWEEYPDDRQFLKSGLYELTYPPIPVMDGITKIQFLGRGRGKLQSLQEADGTPLTADWLGRGLQPKTLGTPIPVRGWRPFSALIPTLVNPTLGLTVTIKVAPGLQVSQLVWQVSAVQP